MTTRRLEHVPCLCSEPRASARAVSRRLMHCECRWIRHTKSGNARVALLFLLVGGPSSIALEQTPTIRLDKPGIEITSNARIEPGVYRLAAAENRAAVIIRGNGITVDFAGATLVGAADDLDPDRYTGRGIVIQGKDITLKNAVVRGYKIGVYAEDAPGLTLDGCDVSRNFRQRLASTPEAEDLSDWIYGHENDDNEWLRYGAGIYMLRCPKSTVRGCRARNGQNGICLVECDETYVVDSDMSFMSGWGLAMWRSSRCEIMSNKFDFCIRGYSHGVYSRGQDSTGILVYEQCSDNVFAYNSATHGGDGFFLYAGNETVNKTGRGGCNNNLLYRNDFSHAAANGIEATFSRGNRFIENILDDCEHGIWAGYSFATIITGNRIRNCRNGISIEHGRDNSITGNTIEDTRLGVHLWWDDDKDLLASAFGRTHDGCPSKQNIISGNKFARVETAIRLASDVGSAVCGNRFVEAKTTVHLAGTTANVTGDLDATALKRVKDQSTPVRGKRRLDEGAISCKMIGGIRNTSVNPEDRCRDRKGKQDAFLPKGARRGRKFIFVDEWGPYDFSDVRLHPKRLNGGSSGVVQILGPQEAYRIHNVTGHVTATPTTGHAPATIQVEATEPGVHRFTFDVAIAGKTLRAQGTLMKAEWEVVYYAWTKENDPRTAPDNWSKIVAGSPILVERRDDLDLRFGHRGPADGLPGDYFATVAKTELRLPAGKWRIKTVSDDGVRVFIDGQEVLTNWTWHGPTPDEAVVDLTPGTHTIRVEHFEIDGYAQLRFIIEPAG
ncbi:MAG: right-handed parallel beta-helix repeat-containing protein [Planctomycetes bacterium]|nr:right-handed parallel beta-helix repeat-containing protein [Planctomycetota bacterium]